MGLLRDTFRDRVVHENGKTLIPHPENPLDVRLHLWLARAFLHGDAADRALGNAIIPSVEFNHACHFCGVVSAVLLYDYAQLNLRRAVVDGQLMSTAVKLETRPPMELVEPS